MNPKVVAVVGLSLVLAASGGVIAMTSGNDNSVKNTGKTSPTSAYTEAAADASGEDIVDDGTFPVIPDDDTEEAAVETNAVPTGYDGTVEPSVPYEEQIVSATMSIRFVVDHSTGAEVSPRVVFGEHFKYCYAAFDADNNFEMCLDPSSGAIRRGTYRIYDNIVSVEYEDGVGSEYELLTDEEGNITHVIVNYGDYDVYFAA